MTADELLRKVRMVLPQDAVSQKLHKQIDEYFVPPKTQRSTLTFNMIHGRHDPKESLDDWGFDGPLLTGISWVACTYNVHWRICFESKEDFDLAKEATGWEEWDENQLLLKFHDDMLEARDSDGKPAWYGDWSIDPSRD
jgi:hypothetical protein